MNCFPWRKRLLTWLALILLFLAVIAAAPEAEAQRRLGKAEYTIKVATLAPEGSTWMNVFNEMNAEIYEKTGKEVKFKAYPGGVLGSEEDVLRKIRVGQVHGAGFTGAGLTEIHRDFRVLNLPLMFESYEEFDYVWERYRPELEAAFRKEGYEVLGWPQLGFTYLFSRKAVPDVEALRRTKPWMMGTDPIMSEFYKSGKVSPVSVDIGDVLTGLQTGLLDTVFNTPLGLIALQWFTRLETMTDLPLTYSLGGIVVTTKKFNSLPADLRQVVREVAGRHMRQLTMETRREDAKSIEVLKKEGIRVVRASGQGLKEFQEISRQVVTALRGKEFSPEAYQTVQGYLAEYRKKQPAAGGAAE